MRYRVTNISPASGELNGVRFDPACNYLITQQVFSKLPRPVLFEWDDTRVVGSLVAMDLEENGSLTGTVTMQEPIPTGYRLGTRFEHAALQEDEWEGHRKGERVIWGLVALSLTATPDPCGDVQTFEELP